MENYDLMIGEGNGPRIIDPSTLDVTVTDGPIPAPDEDFTGVREYHKGVFTALRNGRLVAQHSGPGAKALAYKALNPRAVRL